MATPTIDWRHIRVGDLATITGATQANPVVITSASHPFADGDTVYITDTGGMSEINDRSFTVANKATNTFELSGEDGTGHTAYTSGGQAYQNLAGTASEPLNKLIGNPVAYSADGVIEVASGANLTNITAGMQVVSEKTLSGNSNVDWTSIATGKDRAVVVVYNAQIGTTDQEAVRLSTSSSFVTSGYTTRAAGLSANYQNDNTSATNRFRFMDTDRSTGTHVDIVCDLYKTGGNRWVYRSQASYNSGRMAWGIGHIELGGEMDGVRLFNTSGNNWSGGRAQLWLNE